MILVPQRRTAMFFKLHFSDFKVLCADPSSAFSFSIGPGYNRWLSSSKSKQVIPKA